MEPAVRLFASRVLSQQERLLGDFLRGASAAAESPSVGSPGAADLELIGSAGPETGLGELRIWTHHSCALSIVAAREHGEALRILASGDELLPAPGMALARSVCEAVINVCWLLDAEATSEERLARWAASLLHDSQENPHVLGFFEDPTVVPQQQVEAEEGRLLGQQLMERAGFSLKAKGGDRSSDTANVSFRGARSNLTPRVDELFGRFAPGDEHLWPILSGATHSRGWLVAGLAGDAETVVASMIAPVLTASDALVVEVGRYLGLPVRPVLERTHTHRVAFAERSRPGSGRRAGLDMYRAALGAWAVPL